MKKSILAVAVAAILISCGPKPAAVSLFNGKDLNGWTAVLEDSTLHPSTEFTVEDGAIKINGSGMGEAGAQDGGDLIYANKKFKNFELEFEYKVDAYTGAILESKREAADGTEVPVVQPSKPAASGDIGYAKAKSVALNHAGVSEGKAYDMEIELDDEDGTLVYEVEFKSGNMEYSYEINAATGAILKHESELDD